MLCNDELCYVLVVDPHVVVDLARYPGYEREDLELLQSSMVAVHRLRREVDRHFTSQLFTYS